VKLKGKELKSENDGEKSDILDSVGFLKNAQEY
jgi:hypothetical protein